MKKQGLLTDFAVGIITGFIAAVIIFGVITWFIFINKRNKEKLDYVEKQVEIEGLREDYINRSPDDFLEIPDVRRAADGAAGEFDRRRDEIIQRFRSGNAGR